MRHLNSYRKLGRNSNHRRAMLRNLATSFLQNGRIETTVQRAKELRPIVEKLITIGKVKTVHNIRKVSSYVFTDTACKKVFEDLGKRFVARPGGYTRIIRTGYRHGDTAEMCSIEVVDYHEFEGKVKADVKAKKAEKNNKTST